MTNLGLITEVSWEYWLDVLSQLTDCQLHVKDNLPTPEQREQIRQVLEASISSRGCDFHVGERGFVGVWKGNGRAVTAAVLCDRELSLLIAWCRWLSENLSANVLVA
jgi:hypothetical protein